MTRATLPLWLAAIVLAVLLSNPQSAESFFGPDDIQAEQDTAADLADAQRAAAEAAAQPLVLADNR